MSNSLVHKSLELICNGELHRTRKSAQNSSYASHVSPSTIDHKKDLHREQKKKKKRKNIRYKGALDLIPAKHRISSTCDNTDIYTILSRPNRTTVYETQKRIAVQQDPINDNIERLLLLSNNTIKSKTANNLLQRAVRRKYSQKEEKPKEPEETVFTEEDFKKFEQEYME